METPRSLASSALTHPACRATPNAPNQITILRGNNEAWFLVNSIADKTRGICVCVCVWRGETAHGACVAQTDYRGHEHLRFLSFSLNPKERARRNNPRPRVHFSTLLNIQAMPIPTNSNSNLDPRAPLDRAPLRIFARSLS